MIPMLAVVFTAALSAAPVRLAAPGFQTVSLRNELSLFLANDFANRMREQGIEVETEKDIALMIGIERQKELAGCSEGNCLAELADALGVDGVITGSVGKFGDTYRVLLNVVSAQNAHPLASYSKTVSSQKQVFEALAEAAELLAPQIYTALHREPVRVSAAPRAKSPWGFVSLGGVLGFGGLSAGMFIAAGQEDALLRCDSGACAITQQQAKSAHDQGQLLQGLAIGSLVVAGICAGLALWLFLRD
jgi:hypothetical protein